jgi:glucose/arabinose dehydrogenase
MRRMGQKKRRMSSGWITALALAAVVGLAAGCGGGGSDEGSAGSATATPTSIVSPTSTATGQPFETETPTPTASQGTPTFTATGQPFETPTPTPTASQGTPTSTATGQPFETETPTPTASQGTPTFTATGEVFETETPTSTPTMLCAGVPQAEGTRIGVELIASGLSGPLYVTAPPRDPNRIFIVEQRGRIRVVESGKLLATPFLDLTDRVASGGELGLLSLAFHPRYPDNGELFVDYTTMRDAETLVSVVSRFHVSDDPNVVDPHSEEVVLEQVQPFIAHNGGQLFFDSAGYLYITFGDGGRSVTRQNNAQDPQTWLGKILRIDVDGGAPYAIPPGNPFVGPDGVLDEIIALGFRNPWRASVDVDGTIYVGDVGEGSFEEIDVLSPPDLGANFGWCCNEGFDPFKGVCFQSATTCPASGLTPPVLQYSHEEGGCSVTGGFVYRGCAMPDLRGTYFYGDYCAGFVRSFVLRNGAVEDERDRTEEVTPAEGPTIARIAGFGEDALGEIYIADLAGKVFKMVPAAEAAPADPEGQ